MISTGGWISWRYKFCCCRRLADENKSLSPRTQSPITIDEEDDDALEVLENVDELLSEGVKVCRLVL